MQARFGGNIMIEPTVMFETIPTVRVEVHGIEIPLTPDEARRLAVILIETASETEKPVAPDDAWIDEVTC